MSTQRRHWRSAKVGDSIVTDDGVELVCTAVKEYTDSRGRTRRHLRFGRFSAWDSAAEFVTEDKESWVHRESRKSRTRRAVLLYVELVVAKKPIDWIMVGMVYRPDQKRPDLTAKRLFKEDLVQDMIRTELRKALTAKGISEETVLEMYLGAYNKAAEIGKPSEMRSVAGELAKLLGMNDTVQPKRQEQEEEWEDDDEFYARFEQITARNQRRRDELQISQNFLED